MYTTYKVIVGCLVELAGIKKVIVKSTFKINILSEFLTDRMMKSNRPVAEISAFSEFCKQSLKSITLEFRWYFDTIIGEETRKLPRSASRILFSFQNKLL